MAKRDIVVGGGSAGSREPLRKPMAGLPADFTGAVFVTAHIPSTHQSYLPEMLGQVCKLPVRAGLTALLPNASHG